MRVDGNPTDTELAALAVVLTVVLHQRNQRDRRPAPANQWRLTRQKALGMRRGA